MAGVSMAGALASKIAFITGSESGIGQAIAEEFARAGANVVVTFYADRAGAEETGRRVEGAGRRVHLQQVDVRDEASVTAAFREAAARLGTPEILVNAAGVIGKGMAVADMPAEEFDRVVRTDLY